MDLSQNQCTSENIHPVHTYHAYDMRVRYVPYFILP